MAGLSADQSSRNWSVLAEESGSIEPEHKRPRLLETGTAMDAEASSSLMPPSTPPLSQDHNTSLSPISKVTINTRPLSSQSSHQPEQTSTSHTGSLDAQTTIHPSISPSESPVVINVSDAESSKAPSGDANEPISIPSSPDGSVVQVDGSNDINVLSDEIIWLSSENVDMSLPPDAQQTSMWRTFPYLEDAARDSVPNVLQKLSLLMERNTDNFLEAFTRVSSWLSQILPVIRTVPTTQLAQDAQIWAQLPHFMTGLLKRKVDFPPGITKEDLMDMLKCFWQLTSRLVQTDLVRLRNSHPSHETETVRSLCSLNWLQIVTMLISPDSDSGLLNASQSIHHLDPSAFRIQLAEHLVQHDGPRLLVLLANMFDAMAASTTLSLSSRAELLIVVSCFQAVVRICTLSRPVLSTSEQAIFVKATNYFFNKAQAVFHEGITKQQPWLTIENSPAFVEVFSRLMVANATINPKIFHDVFELARVTRPQVPDADLPDIACCIYKLTIFRIFIQHGRMELRVYAIENMAQEMVNVWQATQCTESFRQTLNQTVVDFLRGNGVVKYIFGVDPHPQIVQRSSNVIGFLCVSGNWQKEDTDLAWQAILDSHDGRAITAFYEVLRINLTHLDATALLYMCSKMIQVDFGKFDNRMLDFIQAFVVDILRQPTREGIDAAEVKLSVLQLCFRLLRESHTPSRCDTDIAKKVKKDISQLFQTDRGYICNFLFRSLDDASKSGVLEPLCRDIQDRTDLANGSILAMNCILLATDPNTAYSIVHQCDYTQILVSNIVHHVEHTQNTISQSTQSCYIDYEIRLSALSVLVVQTPESFDKDMAQSLWDSVLASDLPHAIRSRAWNDLADAFKHSSGGSLILQSFVKLFMDSLPPSRIDRSVLRFVEESIKFETRPAANAIFKEDCEIEIPGQERLWRILLEAPPHTVEDSAADCLIQLYLDNAIVSRQQLHNIDKTHTAFIDRCVQILLDSAQSAKNRPTGEESYQFIDNAATPEIKFHRTLKLLRKFIDGIKCRPRYKMAATVSAAALFQSFIPKGDALDFSAIITGHPDIRNERYFWTVGAANTGSELYDFLSTLTGWDRLNIICGGMRVQAEHLPKPVSELFNGRRAPITVSKAIGATEKPFNRATRASTPVDSKVLRHFEKLYDLLEAEEAIAKPVLEFMTTFTSQETVVNMIRSMSMSPNTLLPTDKPFKTLYHAATMRSCIEEESFSASPDAEFVQFVIRTVLMALPNLPKIEADGPVRARLLQDVLVSLLLALRTKAPPEIYLQSFQQSGDLVRVLLAVWNDIKNLSTVIKGQHRLWPLFWVPLEVITEASLLVPNMWHQVEQDQTFAEHVNQELLLSELIECRQGALDCITRLTGTSTGKTALKANDPRSPRSRFPATIIDNCLTHLWTALRPLEESCWLHPNKYQYYLQAVHAILSVVGESFDSATLVNVFNNTTSALLEYDDDQNLDFQTRDMVLLHLARIATCCLKCCDQKGSKIPGRARLIDRVFNTLLFPPLSEIEQAATKSQAVPILDSDARDSIYALLLMLANSDDCSMQICSMLEEDLVDRDAFALSFSNERAALQSEQGYTGLKNLGTTCYLNSLFCQLFMNIKFRELIFGVQIIDPSKQALVSEMATTFAAMQSSFEKSISPEGAVESIVQFDGEPIDVTVQMDVDEFFNLLFDRLESQIIDAKTRDSLKAVYGGQLVQQIKSKECEHVSERLEPFSTVQIEIKGKTGLEEGLRAYVEGEVLQGDNKYSCTGCGRHVDAVKRACLKEVPDNLIFNLKRFDYDIMTGMRAKINDEFQFPDVINMAPYTIDALSNGGEETPPDMFELVGVIIHTGTAETGHYYSYVRQRPSSGNKRDSWVTFNDTDVTKFNIDELKDQAFGGFDPSFGDFLKMWNGYMLFYQRSSSIEAYTKEYCKHDSRTPLQIRLPERLDADVSLKNEVFLRNFVTQDPTHAKFLRLFLERVQSDDRPCSADHELEQRVTEMVLSYLSRVSSRWKEAPEFEETIKLLAAAAKRCPRCALGILTWFGNENRLSDCLIKAFYNLARKQFAELFYTCCSILWPIPNDRAQDTTISDLGISPKQLNNVLETCLVHIVSSWPLLQRFNRSWDTLLPTLTRIAKLGNIEAHALIESGILAKSLELVWIHHFPKSKATLPSLKTEYWQYIQLRDRNRPFPHQHALDLFAALLPYVRLSDDRKGETEWITRLETSREEQILLGLDTSPVDFGWLRKMILSQASPLALRSVIMELSHYPKLYPSLVYTVSQGLRSDQAHTASLYLMPAINFIQNAFDADQAASLLREVVTIPGFGDGSFAAEQLDALLEIKRLAATTSGMASEDILEHLIAAISSWAPSLLVAHNELNRDIRGETRLLLNNILFAECTRVGIQETRMTDSMTAIRSLAQGCVESAAEAVVAAQSGRATTLQDGQFREITRIMHECVKYLEDDNAEDEATTAEINTATEQLALLGRTIADTEEWRDGSSDQLSEMESYDGVSS